MTKDELEKIKKRLYELQNLSILALNNKDYKKLLNYGKEINQIKKVLKKAQKEAIKNENKKD